MMNMEPLIGVFASQAEAQNAMRELLDREVPNQAIVYLTQEDHERVSCARNLGRFVGAFVGFGTGFSIGIVGCLLLAYPDISQLLLFGFGTATLMSLVCAFAGGALCNAAVSFRPKLRTIGANAANLDFEFVTTALRRGSSVIIVNRDFVDSGMDVHGVLHPRSQYKEAEAASSAA
jgi:hypothetical protein